MFGERGHLTDLTRCCTSILSSLSLSSCSKFKVIQEFVSCDRLKIENPNFRFQICKALALGTPNLSDLHFLVNSVFRERKLKGDSQSTAVSVLQSTMASQDDFYLRY